MYGRDPLEGLWKEILDLHWNYLELEESLKKIDERKKLEGRLREYISIVPHDRKFFLPETEHVLRVSITQMRDFSAFKGAIGFESISQYANNLFTKPWRKEYRVIKVEYIKFNDTLRIF
jgi:spermatogenesis-associated protein 2